MNRGIESRTLDPRAYNPHLLIGSVSERISTRNTSDTSDVSIETTLSRLYLEFLQLTFENTAALHNSPRTSNKFLSLEAAMYELFPDMRSLVLDHINNMRFDEDDPETKNALKEATIDQEIVQDIVTIAKADHALPLSVLERADVISAMLEDHYPDEWIDIMSRPLILKAANDIMVYITLPNRKVIQLYKPVTGVLETDSNQLKREKVFDYLWDFFQDPTLPDTFLVKAKSGCSFTDQRSGKSALSTNTFEHLCSKPTKIGLRTLVHGIQSDTPPELAAAFFEAMTRSAQKDFWTPDQGINLKYVLGVNGGMKLENPLWVLICSIPSSPEELEYYAKLVKGTPLQLERAMRTLLQLIAEEDFNQDFPFREYEELTAEHFRVFEALIPHGVNITGRWVRLLEQDFFGYSQPESVIEKATRLTEIIKAYKQQVPTYVPPDVRV